MNEAPGALTSDATFYGISFNTRDKSVRRFERAGVLSELEDGSVFSWIDVESPAIDDLNQILGELGIDLVLVSHFDAPEVLPRIIEHPQCLAFYLYEIVDPERHLDTSKGIQPIDFARMIMVLGRDYVITYHRRSLEGVDYVKETCAGSFELAGKSPAFITFLFLQKCLYDYAHLNLANDNYLDLLEEGVLAGSFRELAAQVSVAASNILTLKKLVASAQITLMLMVTKVSPFISATARESFADMLQNAQATRGAIDSSRDLLDGVVGSMHAAAANRTSDIARVLTVVSTIILPLTLLAGIYGMNFEHMPELKWRGGYYLVVTTMGIVAFVMLFLFYRLGWLASKRQQ